MAEVRTVSGEVDSDELGLTLTHEHLLCDCRAWLQEPRTERQREYAQGPLSIEILGEARRDALVFEQNLVLDDERMMVEEVRNFSKAGGATIVDLTVKGLSPKPEAVREIAAKTDLNVIMGCGFYVKDSHPPEVAEQDTEALRDVLVREIEDGFDGSGIRPGVIGEIGTSQPVHPDEWKVLKASCQAQMQSGLPLFVHVYPGCRGRTAPEVTDFILSQGVDPARVNICHMDSYMDVDYMESVAKKGVFISFDGFGLEFYYDSIDDYRCCDSEREECLVELLERGYRDQLLISQDVCIKMQLKQFGGYGFDHILQNIIPSLERRGVDKASMQQILVDNPSRILAVG